MEFEDLLTTLGDEPVFEPDRLPAEARQQLPHWVQSGHLYQLHSGLYALAPPFQKISPHPFVVANRLVRGSYVSLQSALFHYGLVPEYVPVMSVTTGPAETWDTPLGCYEFRHIELILPAGCRLTPLDGGQEALVATREKALLDLIDLEDGDPGALQALRLQHLNHLDLRELRRQAEAAGQPKLLHGVEWIEHLARTQIEEYELF
jgi:predicted transcriptional regulator of viral defense system